MDLPKTKNEEPPSWLAKIFGFGSCTEVYFCSDNNECSKSWNSIILCELMVCRSIKHTHTHHDTRAHTQLHTRAHTVPRIRLLPCRDRSESFHNQNASFFHRGRDTFSRAVFYFKRPKLACARIQIHTYTLMHSLSLSLTLWIFKSGLCVCMYTLVCVSSRECFMCAHVCVALCTCVWRTG
jgi:hypothetical protein